MEGDGFEKLAAERKIEIPGGSQSLYQAFRDIAAFRISPRFSAGFADAQPGIPSGEAQTGKPIVQGASYNLLTKIINSAIILVRSVEEALEISNRFAPEHLSIPDASLLPGVRHAGSVFVGPYSPEAAGDYASGPNHVLPTSGAARQRGGLSVTDYLKVISVQELSGAALRKLAPSITTLARAEGLEAHARSVEVRL